MAMADHNGPEEQADDHWQVRDDEDTVEAQRTLAANLLEQIACQVREALRAEDIGMPVFFVIPNSGRAILSFGTPGDPSHDEWERVSEIVTSIVARSLGLRSPRRRELQCATTLDHELRDATA